MTKHTQGASSVLVPEMALNRISSQVEEQTVKNTPIRDVLMKAQNAFLSLAGGLRLGEVSPLVSLCKGCRIKTKKINLKKKTKNDKENFKQ